MLTTPYFWREKINKSKTLTLLHTILPQNCFVFQFVDYISIRTDFLSTTVGTAITAVSRSKTCDTATLRKSVYIQTKKI